MKRDPSLEVYTDLYNFCREVIKTDIPLATKYLVDVCNEIGAKIVYISTDYVFNGDVEGYHKIDEKADNVTGKVGQLNDGANQVADGSASLASNTGKLKGGINRW